MKLIEIFVWIVLFSVIFFFLFSIYHGMCCGAKVECHCATAGGWMDEDVAVDVLAFGTYECEQFY